MSELEWNILSPEKRVIVSHCSVSGTGLKDNYRRMHSQIYIADNVDNLQVKHAPSNCS